MSQMECKTELQPSTAQPGTMSLSYDKGAFKERFRELAFIRGMTQKNIADRLGVTETTISRYASGHRMPNVETLIALADILNVRLDTLVGRGTPPEYGAVQEKLQECRDIFFDRSLPLWSISKAKFTDLYMVTRKVDQENGA